MFMTYSLKYMRSEITQTWVCISRHSPLPLKLGKSPHLSQPPFINKNNHTSQSFPGRVRVPDISKHLEHKGFPDNSRKGRDCVFFTTVSPKCPSWNILTNVTFKLPIMWLTSLSFSKRQHMSYQHDGRVSFQTVPNLRTWIFLYTAQVADKIRWIIVSSPTEVEQKVLLSLLIQSFKTWLGLGCPWPRDVARGDEYLCM